MDADGRLQAGCQADVVLVGDENRSCGRALLGLGGKVLLEHLRGTPFLPMFLRLFGAKMGEGIYMDTTDITEFDCVKVGNHVAMNDLSCLQTHLYEDRVMKVGRIEIGDGVTIGSFATVLYDTKVGDYAACMP